MKPIEIQLKAQRDFVLQSKDMEKTFARLMPRELKDGVLLNFKGSPIGRVDEAQSDIFFDQDFKFPKEIDEDWVYDNTDPIFQYLFGDAMSVYDKIQSLICEGKFKKAKKLIKTMSKDDPDRKKLKKIVKENLKDV
jgi:hypothetical protein